MQAKVRLARNLLAACLIAALAAACQMSGLQAVSGPEAAAERAQRQSRQGDHAAAARNYETAARSAAEPDRNTYWLAAAAQWIAGGDLDAAETAIAMLAPPISAAETRERLRLDVLIVVGPRGFVTAGLAQCGGLEDVHFLIAVPR